MASAHHQPSPIMRIVTGLLPALAILLTISTTAEARQAKSASQSMTLSDVATELAGIQAITGYLKIPDIPGESLDARHEDWIDVLSINHAMTVAITSGGGGGRQAGAPKHEPVQVTKRLDKSTPLLMLRMNQGQVLPLVQIEFVRDSAEGPVPFLAYELTNVFVTSYSVGSDTDAYPIETFDFVYERITMTYWPQKEDGSQGDPVIFSWNLATNTTKTAALEQVDYYVDGSDVYFRWETPMQDGNYGFEVQHLEEDGFKRAAYIPGAGWSDERLSYEVRISGLSEGIHVFRLAALGVGNRVEYSHEMRVSLGVPEGVALTLDDPYPNPFTTSTSIAVSVAEEGDGRISVFDVLGREVAVVFDGTLEPGAKRTFEFVPERMLPVGLYFIRAEVDRSVETRAVTVVR